MSVFSACSYRSACSPRAHSSRNRGQVSSASPTKITSTSPSNQFSATLIQGPPTTVKMPRSASSTQDLAHPVALDRHAGQADDVERLERIEVDLLDVLVDDDDLMLRRA